MFSGIRILALHWFDVCSPWRITIPLAALRNVGCEVREAPITRDCDLGDADLVILHRPNSQAALVLIQEARRRGVATVVDVDDLFLPDQLPPQAPFSKVWHPLFKRWEAEAQAAAGIGSWEAVQSAPRSAVMDRFHACLRTADAVTVTTQPLAEAYAGFNSSVHVLPNCYDDANVVWNLAPPSRETVNIGFAGTDHHLDNLALLRGSLEAVLRARPLARIVEAGGPALLPQINAPANQLVHLGTLPFEMFPLLLQQMDIVLAPLAEDLFMRSKSNIRCLTAGLVGAPVVASPVGPYAEYVEHGSNGFLARTPDEWTGYVEQLVADPELRHAMGDANRRKARAYAMSTNSWRWLEVYEEILGRHRSA